MKIGLLKQVVGFQKIKLKHNKIMLSSQRIKQIEVVEELTKSYYGEEAYSGGALLERMNEDYANLKITEKEWKEYIKQKLKNATDEYILLHQQYFDTSRHFSNY